MSRRGFTLIEMLVVVGIIMILAAIVYPVYELALKRAESMQCASNLRNLAHAASLYAEDHDGLLVPAVGAYGDPGTIGTSWDVILLGYHRAQGMYLCAGDQAPTWTSGMVCYKHSYGINYDLTMVGGYAGWALCTSQIPDPTRTILFFDIAGSPRSLGSSYGVSGLSRVDKRHHEGSNFSFLDGHVKWYQPRQTARPSGNMWLP